MDADALKVLDSLKQAKEMTPQIENAVLDTLDALEGKELCQFWSEALLLLRAIFNDRLVEKKWADEKILSNALGLKVYNAFTAFIRKGGKVEDLTIKGD